MYWFAITPVLGGEMHKSERFRAPSNDAGIGRALGRFDERFEAKGHAYAALLANYRVDRLGPNPDPYPQLSADTLLGTITPEVGGDGSVTAAWEPAMGEAGTTAAKEVSSGS